MKHIKTIAILSLLSLASCGEEYSNNELQELLDGASYHSKSSEVAEVAAWEDYAISDRYSEYVEEGLELYGSDLLSSDLLVDDAGFCPNYNELSVDERMAFWVMMVSSIAEHESRFDTDAEYREKNGKYSRGLLQLGFSSTRGYNCGLENQYELNSNPRKNLHCGVKILNHWIKRDQAIRNPTSRTWRGGARYWSVLRFEIWSTRKRNRLLGIKRNTNALSFCN